MAAVTKETLLRYCQKVYDAMEVEAERDDKGTLVWQGRIVKLFTDQSISNAHYTKVMGTLAELGSVEQLQRGARSVPSVYALHFRPETAETGQTDDSGLTKPSALDKLSQRVRLLERRLEGIELNKVLANFEKRLSEVEARKRSAK